MNLFCCTFYEREHTERSKPTEPPKFIITSLHKVSVLDFGSESLEFCRYQIKIELMAFFCCRLFLLRFWCVTIRLTQISLQPNKTNKQSLLFVCVSFGFFLLLFFMTNKPIEANPLFNRIDLDLLFHSFAIF